MNNPKINEIGIKEWYNEKGQLHRENGPAIEWSDGNKYWFLNGEFHRKDGPAIEWTNGTKYWYLNGKELTKEEWIIQTKFNFQKIIIK